MMVDAYQLSLIAVLCGLCAAILRAAAVRPGVSLAAGITGTFFIGYVVSSITHRSDATWSHAVELSAPAQSEGAAQGEAVLALAPNAALKGVSIRRGDRISTDIFDLASAGVPTNQTVLHLPSDAKLRMAGWAADSNGSGPCKQFFLAVDSRRFKLPYGFAREDVATYFHDRAYTMTGYNAQLSAKALGAGTHSIRFECLSADGKTLFVSTKAYTVSVE